MKRRRQPSPVTESTFPDGRCPRKNEGGDRLHLQSVSTIFPSENKLLERYFDDQAYQTCKKKKAQTIASHETEGSIEVGHRTNKIKIGKNQKGSKEQSRKCGRDDRKRKTNQIIQDVESKRKCLEVSGKSPQQNDTKQEEKYEQELQRPCKANSNDAENAIQKNYNKKKYREQKLSKGSAKPEDAQRKCIRERQKRYREKKQSERKAQQNDPEQADKKKYEQERQRRYREKKQSERSTEQRDAENADNKKYELERKRRYREKKQSQRSAQQNDPEKANKKKYEQERKRRYREKKQSERSAQQYDPEKADKKKYELERQRRYREKKQSERSAQQNDPEKSDKKRYEQERQKRYRKKKQSERSAKQNDPEKADKKKYEQERKRRYREKKQSERSAQQNDPEKADKKKYELERKRRYREKKQSERRYREKKQSERSAQKNDPEKADKKKYEQERKRRYREKKQSQRSAQQNDPEKSDKKKYEQERKRRYREKKQSERSAQQNDPEKADKKKYELERKRRYREKKQSERSAQQNDPEKADKKKYEQERQRRYREKKQSERSAQQNDPEKAGQKKYDLERKRRYREKKQSKGSNEQRDAEKAAEKKNIGGEREPSRQQRHQVEEQHKCLNSQQQIREIPMQSVIAGFHDKIKEGPVFICCSCQRLLYKVAVKRVGHSTFLKCSITLLERCTTDVESSDGFKYICNACYGYLKKNEIPPLSVGNKLQLTDIPEELKNLSSLEVTLISKRIPFMKILGLPRGKQKAVHGCVVNVPLNPDETCGVLPRLPSSSTITVKLKRKIKYRGHVMKQIIRPWRVLCALYYLKQHNKHYNDVAINDAWQEDCELQNSELWQNLTESEGDSSQAIQLVEERDGEEPEPESTDIILEEQCSSNSDSLEEDNDFQDQRSKLSGLPFDSCLQPKDISSDSDFLLSIAPGEGKKPLSFQTDKYSEEMAFPNLFPNGSFGFHSDRPKKLSIKQYFKARILCHDSRFSSSIEYLFFSQYRCESKEIADCLSMAMRKCKGQVMSNKVTAGEIKDAQSIRQLARNDLSYHFMQKVRGSPAYYNKMLYDLFGMIRHLGACTWFLTLSAADMRWADTIQIIGAQHGQNFSEEDVNSMTWEEKSLWLRTNPVTAARHFDHRLQLFVDSVLLSEMHPVGQIQDFKYRIEFQQRGSPHAHMVIWVKDAPSITDETTQTVKDFVDMYVTCALPPETEELREIVQTVQMHTHSVACRKAGKSCRFGFPLPPMPETTVLLPLKDQPDEETVKCYRQILLEVQTKLEDVPMQSTMQLSDILSSLQVSMEAYVKAVCWLKTKNGQPSILLKRLPAESRVNFYNKTLLSAWTANMDIQFVTNVYACVMYVASYMSKPEKTLGDLLKSVSKTCEPQGPKSRMQTVAKKFLTHREVSAQEAVYRLLSLPLSRSSRQVVFVPTNLPEDRTFLLKPLKVIQAMEDDEEDILLKGTIHRYTCRPQSLEALSLADFVSHYRTVPKKELSDETECSIDLQVSDTQQMSDQTLPSLIQLLDNEGSMALRKRPIILRTHQFSKDKDEEQFFHAKLMLYFPWRCEESDLKATDGTYKNKFLEVYQQIEANLLFYEPNAEEVADAAAQLEDNGPPEDAWATLAPEVEQQEEHDQNEGSTLDPDHLNLYNSDNFNPEDIGLIPYQYEVVVNQICREKWLHMTASLNEEQRHIHQYIVQWCLDMSMTYRSRTRPKPFHLFISGGAGVGKSHLIRTIVQTTTRLLNVGQTEDDIVVLVAAYTGVAAFMIGGQTLHSILHIPVFQRKGSDYIPLASEQLAKMKGKLGNLCLLIIDEISFIHSDFLLTLHRRLTDIMTSDEPFGGISVLAVGDLFQLPPVAKPPIFMPGSSDMLANLYGSLWCKHFQLVELNKIMRQKDDLQFAEALNRIRVGDATDDDILLLKTREVEESSPTYPAFALHIFPYNKDVDRHNFKTLESLNASIVTLLSEDTTKDKETGQVRNISLGDHEGQLPRELKLSEGARVSLTVNIDLSDGLVNAATGTITAFYPKPVPGDESYKALYILVEFDGESGKNTKGKFKHLFGNTSSTPIKQHTVDVKKGPVTAQRKQFPLRLAWASTIHKAQGKTLDTLVVCNIGCYRAGQMYTALSRVKTLEGLFILNGFSMQSIKVDKRILSEMDRLRSMRKFKFLESNISRLPDVYLKLSMLNVNSIKPHFECLVTCPGIHDADIVFLPETWLQKKDSSQTYELSEEFAVYRCDRKPSRAINPHGGVAIEVKKTFHVAHMFSTAFSSFEQLALLLEHRMSGERILVVGIYKSPLTPMAIFEKQLDCLLTALPIQNVPTILAGDFNVSASSENAKLIALHKITNYHGFRQYISKPTHRSGNLLDHMYINRWCQGAIPSTDAVHFSDHFHVQLAVPVAELMATSPCMY